jgi:hypothetical protein
MHTALALIRPCLAPLVFASGWLDKGLPVPYAEFYVCCPLPFAAWGGHVRTKKPRPRQHVRDCGCADPCHLLAIPAVPGRFTDCLWLSSVCLFYAFIHNPPLAPLWLGCLRQRHLCTPSLRGARWSSRAICLLKNAILSSCGFHAPSRMCVPHADDQRPWT